MLTLLHLPFKTHIKSYEKTIIFNIFWPSFHQKTTHPEEQMVQVYQCYCPTKPHSGATVL